MRNHENRLSRLVSGKRNRRPYGLTLAVALSATALAACGGGDAGERADGADAIASAAKDEAEVIWYTTLVQEVADAVAADFEKESGISVRATRAAPGDLIGRISAERSAGSHAVDVLTVAEPLFMEDSYQDGWFAKLDEADVPSLEEWPEDALSHDSLALIVQIPLGVAYNTDKVKADEVDTWEEILDPKFKGEIAIPEPSKSLTWSLTYGFLEDEIDDQYLERLAKLKPTIHESIVPASQELAAGSGSIVLPNHAQVIDPLKAQGAPVEMAFPTPTVGVEQYSAVLEEAPNPNAGLLFQNYLLSPEGQTVLNRGSGFSALGELEGTVPEPDGYLAAYLTKELAARESDFARQLGIK